ncbi:MAG: AMP-binding protein [Alphaproteobacteria bacterium]
MVNLSSYIRYHALRAPERIAILYDGQRISYGQFWDRIQRLAGWLAARGIGPDDVVAVFMKNSAAFLDIAFATSHLGAVFLPVNYRLASEEVAYIVSNAEAKLLLADSELGAVVEGAATDIVLLDHNAQRDSRVIAGFDRAPVPCHARSPGDLFRLMYTSGTTDHPKGVRHTYANYYWKNLDQIIHLNITAEDKLLAAAPLYHVGAFDLPGTAVLSVGGTMSILRDFDPEEALASIERDHLTCSWMAPVMLGRALDYRGQFNTRSLKWCVGGGEKTPEARIRAFRELFPLGRFVDGYGLTESCGGDTLMEAGRELEKIGSTGRALAHVEVRIADEEGVSLPAGKEGEICLRGPKVTEGYWRDEAKTKASFFGAWFRTGDVGYLDEEGFLYITDRKKDMIISGGENIASSEVERVIYELPEVRECAVVGLPDPLWGERPVAVVVLNEGAALSLADLARHCREHLASFKVPRQLSLIEALPRNPSGKVLKRVLRDRLMNQPIQIAER